MSRFGRWAAVAAIVLGAVTVATWSRGERDAGASPNPNGAALFVAKGCSTCHTGPDTHAPFDAFPSLQDAPAWAGDRKPRMSAAAYLAESMATPGAFISPAFRGGAGPTTGMPQLRLTTHEIDALVAYLLHR